MSIKKFTVLCTVPSGEVKEYEFGVLLDILINRNNDAHKVEKLFQFGPNLLAGQRIDGAEVNMLGYSFIKK